ncbi:unnamed protein product, partial [Prorocentrum cordatum]
MVHLEAASPVDTLRKIVALHSAAGASLAARSDLAVTPSSDLDVERHGGLDLAQDPGLHGEDEFSVQGAEVENGMVRGSIGQVGAHCDARGPAVVLEAEGHREAGASADPPSMPAVPHFPSLGAEAQSGTRGAFDGGDYVEHNNEHDGAQDVGQCDEDEPSVDAKVAADPESDGDVPPPLNTVAVANFIRVEGLRMVTFETLRSADDGSMLDAEMECSEVE